MPKRSKTELARDVKTVLAELKSMGSQEDIDGMARFGIKASKVFGVSVNELRQLAKTIAPKKQRGDTGKDHELALALWDTGWFEARLLASMLADPAQVTPALMEKWCREFENWADCDTVCFHLFDKTPHAFAMIKKWATRRNEFEKRAAFALIASVALHDKKSPDKPLLEVLPLCLKAASDDRNFVKKGVSWALRGAGSRSYALHTAAVKIAKDLAESKNSSERWVGKDVLRDLNRPLVAERLLRKAKKSAKASAAKA